MIGVFFSIGLLCVFASMHGISGHITTNTIWSTDQIVTGDLWVDPGVTLTIQAGVNVTVPFLDANSDQVGDVDIIVDGRLIVQGTSNNLVVFESLESVPGNRDWGGIDILTPQNGSTTILNWVLVKNANQGVYINGKGISAVGLSVTESGDYGLRVQQIYSSIDISQSRFETSLGFGLLLEYGTIQLTNVLTYRNGLDGVYATGNATLTANQLVSASNCGSGVTSSNAQAVNISHSKLILNELHGYHATGAGNTTISYSEIESNFQCGVFVKSAPVSVTYSNIRYNGSAGIMSYLATTSFSYNNIYGNVGQQFEEVVNVGHPSNTGPNDEWGGLHSSDDLTLFQIGQNVLQYPVYVTEITHIAEDLDNFLSPWEYIDLSILIDNEEFVPFYFHGHGSIPDPITTGPVNKFVPSYRPPSPWNAPSRMILSSDSYVSGAWVYVSQIKHSYTFENKQVTLWNPTGVLNYQHNWWGQVAGLDSLIYQFYNNSVDYSGQEIQQVVSAGSGMSNLPPSISLVSPSTLVTDQTQTTISWTARDIDDNAEISLYYDLTMSYQGTPFIQGLGEDEFASYIWDYSNIPDGIYNIYAEIDDGVNPVVRDYAPGKIVKGPIKVYIPNDLTGTPGEQVSVPVYLSNVLPQYNVISYQATVTFNPNLVTCTGIDTSETLSYDWIVNANTSVPGQVTFNGFGTTAISDPGILLKLILQLNPSALNNQSTELIFNSAYVNNHNPTLTTGSGLLTIRQRFSFSGSVLYYENNIPMQNIVLTASGQSSGSQITNISGQYSFSQMFSGTYTLTPLFTGTIPDLLITPFDASLVARYAIGLITLTPSQLIASDVDADGEVAVYDAALIAQFSVGLIDTFAGSPILFIPPEINFALNSNVTDQLFNAIAIGDPSGNWSNAPSHTVEQLPLSLTKKQGNRLKLKFSALQPFGSYLIKLEYNADEMECIGVSFSDLLSDFSQFEVQAPGIITLAGYSVGDITSTDPMVEVDFMAIEGGEVSPVQVVACLFDDEHGIVVSPVDASDECLVPNSLKQNYPNPFNPITLIKYTIANPAVVSLEIYNLKGQMVTTLVSTFTEAGEHNTVWDASGFASGVYIYRMMINGKLAATRKMLLLK